MTNEELERLTKENTELKNLNETLMKKLKVYEPFSRCRSSYFDLSRFNQYKVKNSIEQILGAISLNSLKYKSNILYIYIFFFNLYMDFLYLNIFT